MVVRLVYSRFAELELWCLIGFMLVLLLLFNRFPFGCLMVSFMVVQLYSYDVNIDVKRFCKDKVFEKISMGFPLTFL